MHIIADSDGALLDDISFGNGSSGQGTTCGTDADPDPNTWNATGVWETMTGDQTSIQVYDNQSGAYAGNHCVHLKPYVILERYWGWAPMEYPSIANENFTFEFAFKVGNPLYGIGFAGLGRRNDQNSYNTQQGVGVGVQGNELCVYYYTPGQPHNLSNLPTFGFASVPVLANTWYHVRMVTSVDPCQMSMPSFDLYVNHQLVATGLPWNQYSYAFGDPVGLNSVQLLNHESDSAGGVSFDNIRLLPGEGLCDPDSSTYATDINRDCHVDILDLKELVSKWLWCTRPEDGNCSVL
jgi:hypothetical protein